MLLKEDGGLNKKAAKVELKINKNLKRDSTCFYADVTSHYLLYCKRQILRSKDGAIRHVMSGINPQGCRVHNFKTPSKKNWITITCGDTTKYCRERNDRDIQPLALRKCIGY